MPTLASRHTRCVCSATLLLLSAAPPSIAQVRPQAHTLEWRIDSLVGREADAKLLSGVVLLARGDRIVFQRGYGSADFERQVPNAPSIRFGIGSITKVLTETLVAMLVNDGRLDLDAPVAKYLGDFPRGPNGGVVTNRHLLEHRAGVPHRVTTLSEETTTLHPADIVDRVRKVALLFEPGTKELYSSAGFTCLARVIEVIEGRPFDEILRDRIFRPASMSSATDETGQQLMLRRALPYRLSATADTLAVASVPYQDLSFLAGAGSVYATAEDLLHFSRALRTGVFGVAGQRQGMPNVGTVWRAWYGRTNGYESSVDYEPTQDVTFIFLSNLRSGANWQVREQVKSLLLRRTPVAIPRPPAVASGFEAPASFVGSYGDPADPIVISVVDGHLFRDDSEFYPIGGGKYYLPASGSIMRFSRSSDGAADALLTVRGSGQETSAPRVARRP
jgi:CubicO group peptidase (beta-lactamase class C family)